MAAKDYANESYVNRMKQEDWDALKLWVKGNDKWDVTYGDLDKARGHQGWWDSNNRNEVDTLLKAYLESEEYKTRWKDVIAAEEEGVTTKLNKDKAKDLLLSIELGTPQGLVLTDPELKKQYEKASAEFQFERYNPYVQAQERQIRQSNIDLRKQMAANLAARGVQDTGETAKVIAGAGIQQGTQMANMQGADYLRQFQQWKENQEKMLRNVSAAYGMESAEYDKAMANYYGNLQLVSEQTAAQKASQPDTNWGAWGSLGLGALSLAAIPFTGGLSGALAPALIGGGAGLLGGGLQQLGVQGASQSVPYAANAMMSGYQANAAANAARLNAVNNFQFPQPTPYGPVNRQ